MKQRERFKVEVSVEDLVIVKDCKAVEEIVVAGRKFSGA
jgi:hypothetical protein